MLCHYNVSIHGVPKTKTEMCGTLKPERLFLLYCITINVCVLVIRYFAYLVHGNVVAYLAASPPSMGTFRSCEGGIWYYGEHKNTQNNVKMGIHCRWISHGVTFTSCEPVASTNQMLGEYDGTPAAVCGQFDTSWLSFVRCLTRVRCRLDWWLGSVCVCVTGVCVCVPPPTRLTQLTLFTYLSVIHCVCAGAGADLRSCWSAMEVNDHFHCRSLSGGGSAPNYSIGHTWANLIGQLVTRKQLLTCHNCDQPHH